MADVTSRAYLTGQAPGPDGKYITGHSAPMVISVDKKDMEVKIDQGNQSRPVQGA